MDPPPQYSPATTGPSVPGLQPTAFSSATNIDSVTNDTPSSTLQVANVRTTSAAPQASPSDATLAADPQSAQPALVPLPASHTPPITASQEESNQSTPVQASVSQRPAQQSAAVQASPATTSDSNANKTVDVSKGLAYRRAKPALLAVLLVSTTSLSWVLLFAADRRSHNSMDATISRSREDQVHKLIRAAWILHTVGALIALSAVTTILSIGAVILTTRRREDQRLNIRQVFALADARWATEKLRTGEAGLFATLACTLTFLSILTPFLQSVLVHNEMRGVLFCPNGGPWTPECDKSSDIYQAPSLIASTTPTAYLSGYSNTIGETIDILQDPWSNSLLHGPQVDPVTQNVTDVKSWVSTVPKRLVTGPIRQATIQTFNRASCSAVDLDEWPQDCSSYSSSDVPSSEGFFVKFNVSGATAQVCAPASQSPSWLSQGTLQYAEIENFYVSLNVDASQSRTSFPDIPGFILSNFSLNCTGSSRSGFYEIPNDRNGFSERPVFEALEDIPPQVFVPISPLWEDPVDIGPYSPFRLAVASLFGIQSYLQNILTTSFDSSSTGIEPSTKCAHSPMSGALGEATFSQRTDNSKAAFLFRQACVRNLNYVDDETSRWNTIRLFFGAFSDPHNGAAAVKSAMDSSFIAIHTGAKPSDVMANQVPVIGGSGHMMLAPEFSNAAEIIMWALVSLQILFLILALAWAVHQQTWTATLDAFAIARLASDLANQGYYMPPLGFLVPEDISRLQEMSGMVGVAERDLETDSPSLNSPSAMHNWGNADEVELQQTQYHHQAVAIPPVIPHDPVSVPSSASQATPRIAINNAVQTLPAAQQHPMPVNIAEHAPMTMPMHTIPWTPEAEAEAALVVDGPPMGPNNSEIPQELTMPTVNAASQDTGLLPPSYDALMSHNSSGQQSGSGLHPRSHLSALASSRSANRPTPLIQGFQGISPSPPSTTPSLHLSNMASHLTSTDNRSRIHYHRPRPPFHLSVGAPGFVPRSNPSPTTSRGSRRALRSSQSNTTNFQAPLSPMLSGSTSSRRNSNTNSNGHSQYTHAPPNVQLPGSSARLLPSRTSHNAAVVSESEGSSPVAT
ncbi:hypothetical protein Cpir12675_006943 [Ceratocystis pirilliformis]|uniref:Transmembrane protein n=1 Tax=Ceratocystis pirilliformis TaxID=259994 RepID=A0ABR3YDY3_9PEZI